MSRRADVYALHMEYNRIAVVGSVDLANHLGHTVIVTGEFEERGDELRFVADEVAHIASTCEAQA